MFAAAPDLKLLAPGHGGARVDVLAHDLHIVPRGDVDRNLRPQPRRIRHAAQAAVVVEVRVADDDGADAGGDVLAQRLGCEGHGRAGRLDVRGAVEHDPARLRAHERQVREVKAPYLIDLLRHDLEQPRDKVCAPAHPETRVDALVRDGTLQEAEGVEIPDDVAVPVADHKILCRAHKALARQLQLAPRGRIALQTQFMRELRVHRFGVCAGGLGAVGVVVGAHPLLPIAA